MKTNVRIGDVGGAVRIQYGRAEISANRDFSVEITELEVEGIKRASIHPVNSFEFEIERTDGWTVSITQSPFESKSTFVITRRRGHKPTEEYMTKDGEWKTAAWLKQHPDDALRIPLLVLEETAV